MFSLPSVGAFAVLGGAEIVVDRDRAATDEVLRHHLLGSALGLLLQQRGALVLHASAVEVQGRAVVLMGPAGRGKSTLAAHLHLHGCGFVADDVTVVDLSGATPRVCCGPPRLRLPPDAAAPLRLPQDAQSRTGLADGKLELSVEPAPGGPPGLGAVLALAAVGAPTAAPLSAARGLAELMSHVYRIDWYGPQLQTRHFDRCARLSEAVAVHRLGVSRSPRGLGQAAQQVMALLG